MGIYHLLVAMPLFILTPKAISKPINPLYINSLRIDTMPKVKSKKIVQAGKRKGNDRVIDPKLERLCNEVKKQSDALAKLFTNPDVQKQQAVIDEQIAENGSLISSPDIKRLEERRTRISEEYNNSIAHDTVMEKINEKMKVMDEAIQKAFNDPAYVKIAKQYEEETWELQKSRPGTNTYAKHQAELLRLNDAMSKMPPAQEIARKSEMSKQMYEQLRQTRAEAYKSNQSELVAINDSINQLSQKLYTERQQKNMELVKQKSELIENNPQYKAIQARLQEATGNLRAYIYSSPYKNLFLQLPPDIQTQLILSQISAQHNR